MSLGPGRGKPGVQVKYYAQLVIERIGYRIESVKVLLSTLTIDQRWGVILDFEDATELTHLLRWWQMRQSGGYRFLKQRCYAQGRKVNLLKPKSQNYQG